LSIGAAKAPSAPAAAAPRATTATAAAPVAQTRSAPAVQRAAPAAVPTIGALDNILVIAAVVAGLFAAGTVVWMFVILKNAIG